MMNDCAICGSDSSYNMFNINSAVLDGSKLYKTIRVSICGNCGHIYNQLTQSEIENLMRYYNEEYAPLNLSSKSKVGDRPGSTNSLTIKRHEQLYGLVSNHVEEDSMILDIGCGMGGFLNFLSKKGYENLYGIDMIEDYVNNSESDNVKLGNIYSIPFEDNMFDIIILDQVLEHLVDLKGAITEVKRVLKDYGLIFLGVPDASRYKDVHFFDFYWFLLREHVQHFDFEHLKMFFKLNNFELIRFDRSEVAMMSEKMILPNLNVIFYLNDKKDCFKLRDETFTYINGENIVRENTKDFIDNLCDLQRPLYLWGIGREFLYLYENTNLKHCDIVLVDDISLKNEEYKVDGRKIHPSSVLKDATEDSILMITAVAHTDVLKKKALEINFKGEIIEISAG